jgi:hypothetical protein
MRYFSIFGVAVVATQLACAEIISFDCSVGGHSIGSYADGSGALDYSCPGFDAPALFEITAVSIEGRVDYQFGANPGPNTFEVSWALPAGWVPTPLVVSNTGGESSTPPIPSSTSNLTGLPTLSIANFVVTGTGSTPQGTVASGAAALTVTYTYEIIPNDGVPEPASLGLVGFALAVAGVWRIRRHQGQ